MQLAAIDPFNYRQIELFCLAFSSEIQRSPAARLDEAARFTVPPTFLSLSHISPAMNSMEQRPNGDSTLK